MNPAQKALWFIESHLADELTLDEIAGVAGISRFHMVRAFAAATGLSVMRYVRVRRLSEAARALVGGAPDILTLALDADYGSHEAFSRVRIPEQRYAVFTHSDHVSTIRRTVNTIWNQWLPASGLKAADAPFFERYDENFDPLTGNGGLEIWVPVKE